MQHLALQDFETSQMSAIEDYIKSVFPDAEYVVIVVKENTNHPETDAPDTLLCSSNMTLTQFREATRLATQAAYDRSIEKAKRREKN